MRRLSPLIFLVASLPACGAENVRIALPPLDALAGCPVRRVVSVHDADGSLLAEARGAPRDGAEEEALTVEVPSPSSEMSVWVREVGACEEVAAEALMRVSSSGEVLEDLRWQGDARCPVPPFAGLPEAGAMMVPCQFTACPALLTGDECARVLAVDSPTGPCGLVPDTIHLSPGPDGGPLATECSSARLDGDELEIDGCGASCPVRFQPGSEPPVLELVSSVDLPELTGCRPEGASRTLLGALSDGATVYVLWHSDECRAGVGVSSAGVVRTIPEDRPLAWDEATGQLLMLGTENRQHFAIYTFDVESGSASEDFAEVFPGGTRILGSAFDAASRTVIVTGVGIDPLPGAMLVALRVAESATAAETLLSIQSTEALGYAILDQEVLPGGERAQLALVTSAPDFPTRYRVVEIDLLTGEIRRVLVSDELMATRPSMALDPEHRRTLVAADGRIWDCPWETDACRPPVEAWTQRITDVVVAGPGLLVLAGLVQEHLYAHDLADLEPVRGAVFGPEMFGAVTDLLDSSPEGYLVVMRDALGLVEWYRARSP